MRFELQLEIDGPIDAVWAAFVDRARAKEWQATLRAVVPVSGSANTQGAVTRLTYREGGRDVVMTETISEVAAPSLLTQELVASMMTSTMRNRFTPVGDDRTRWTLECDLRFRGLWALVGPLARRTIIRKTEEDMRRFQRLAESPSVGSSASVRARPDRHA